MSHDEATSFLLPSSMDKLLSILELPSPVHYKDIFKTLPAVKQSSAFSLISTCSNLEYIRKLPFSGEYLLQTDFELMQPDILIPLPDTIHPISMLCHYFVSQVMNLDIAS